MALRLNRGNIPVIQIRATTLPEAWEKIILALWKRGIDIRTEYDKKDGEGKFIDPPSKDATVTVVVDSPFAEPRIHRNIPCGFEELEIYRQEVVYGIHDHWIDLTDRDKWTYTYHQRLCGYVATEDVTNPSAPHLSVVDQINYIIEKSAKVFYSRRAQAITWIPNADPQTDDPPCLQRIWVRICPDERGEPVLNLNSHWRSRDAYKAWFMNAFALTDLQAWIAARISEKWGKPVKVGRYMDVSDSLHIYGSYFLAVEPEIEKMREYPDYKERAMRSDDPRVLGSFEDIRARLKADVDFQKAGSK